MKKFKKLMVVVLSALMVFAACAVLTACPPIEEEGHAFTVTIYDVDGTPCTWITGIQACKVAEGGGLGACFTAIGRVDENGVAFLDYGSDPFTQLTDESVTYVEIHLMGLPGYLTFDTLRMNKGESATINLRYKTDAELNQPISGDGTAVYLTGDDANKIDTSAENFKPYAVSNSAQYRLKFTSSDQKIYFALNAALAQDYKVFVVGGLNVKITQLSGDTTNGIVNSGEATSSANGEDCAYTFSTEAANQTIYFEVSLEDATDINKDGIICFAYNV